MTEHLKSRFQKYHQDKGFSIYNSFPLVTTDDPTVLFTNATITPFKKMFTGETTAENYALVQKCLRLGGTGGNADRAREDIYYTSLFEMLGSGYFGVSPAVALDYFVEMLEALGLQRENMIFSSIDGNPLATALMSSTLDSYQIRIVEDPKKLQHEWSFGEGDLHGVGVIAWFISEGQGEKTALSDCLQIGRIVHIDGISEGESVKPLGHMAFDVGLGLGRVERAITGKGDASLKPWRDLSEQFRNIFKQITAGDAHYMSNLCLVIDELTSKGLEPGKKKHGYVLRKVIRSLIEEVWLQSKGFVNVTDTLSGYIEGSSSKSRLMSAISQEESSMRQILSQAKSMRDKHPDMALDDLYSTFGIRPNLLSLQMEVQKQRLQFNNTDWSFVKTRTLGQGDVYLSNNGDSYLRIGPKNSIRDEVEFAKTIHGMGFPTPEVLSDGEVDADTYYFTETSLGTRTLGNIFREEYASTGAIGETSFDQYCNIASQFLVAQLKSSPLIKDKGNLREGIKLDNVIEENPDLDKEDLEEAFARAEMSVASLPQVLTHGDLGPFNMLPGGVIDFEHKFIAPVGFDVITSVFNGRFWNFTIPDGDSYLAYDFSEKQIRKYLDTMDTVASNLGLEDLSSFTDDMLLLKAIWQTSFEKQIAKKLGNNYRWQNKRETLRYCINQYLASLPIDTTTFGQHLGY